MSGLPTKCLSCGFVWQSTGIRIFGGEGTVSGNVSAGCPRCRGIGKVGDGHFTFDNDGRPAIKSAPAETHQMFAQLFHVLRDNSVTPEDIASLADIAKDLKSGSISPETAAAAAEAVNVKFAGLIDGQEAGWLALILAIVTLFLTRAESGADHREVMEALRDNREVAEQELEVSRAQLESLRRIADAKTGRGSPGRISAAPEGHRTKRQQRRDKRFICPE